MNDNTCGVLLTLLLVLLILIFTGMQLNHIENCFKSELLQCQDKNGNSYWGKACGVNP